VGAERVTRNSFRVAGFVSDSAAVILLVRFLSIVVCQSFRSLGVFAFWVAVFVPEVSFASVASAPHKSEREFK
jgi:hypothetical protein